MNYKLNYMCWKRGVSLILGHGVADCLSAASESRDVKLVFS